MNRSASRAASEPRPDPGKDRIRHSHAHVNPHRPGERPLRVEEGSASEGNDRGEDHGGDQVHQARGERMPFHERRGHHEGGIRGPPSEEEDPDRLVQLPAILLGVHALPSRFRGLL